MDVKPAPFRCPLNRELAYPCGVAVIYKRLTELNCRRVAAIKSAQRLNDFII
jgi:hypothetical protein